MKLTFLGTHGEIEARSRRHQRHSALLVQHNEARIMIDCGADWLHRLRTVAPTAIVLTHAHSDHAAGLAGGAPCPVYATAATWKSIRHFPIRHRRSMPLRRAVTIDGVRFKAFPVEHSIRAPAVGLRVSADGGCFFYLPDVAELPDASDALRGIDVYIGDGATLRRSMVRKKAGTAIGHAAIVAQLDWCAKAHVRCAVFTHYGSAIVHAASRAMDAVVSQLGREQGLDARLVGDGDQLCIPCKRRLRSNGLQRHARY